MYTIEQITVKGYEFKGYIDSTQLTLDQLKALGIKSQPNVMLEVEGSFNVNWDDDIAMPQIESCYILGDQNGKTCTETRHVQYSDISNKMLCYKVVFVNVPAVHILDLDLDTINLESIESDIASNDSGDWYSDRLAGMADYYYDRDR